VQAVYPALNRNEPGYQRLIRQLSFQNTTADGGQVTAELVAAIETKL